MAPDIDDSVSSTSFCGTLPDVGGAFGAGWVARGIETGLPDGLFPSCAHPAIAIATAAHARIRVTRRPDGRRVPRAPVFTPGSCSGSALVARSLGLGSPVSIAAWGRGCLRASRLLPVRSRLGHLEQRQADLPLLGVHLDHLDLDLVSDAHDLLGVVDL